MTRTARMNVVLIGIDAYEDREVPDTLGARADVAALWRVCVDQLQVQPERVEIVAPVALRPEELVAGASGHPADWLRHAERTVRHEGARREDLVRVLGRVAALARAGEPVWVHFSGHGTTAGDTDALADLVLCPQDYGADDPAGRGLSFAALEELFGAAEACARTTLTLDCCWVGAGVPEAHPALRPVPFRTLVATSPEQAARVVRLGGVEHGAFSWALGVALSRWTRTRSRCATELTVSHADLLGWVRQLLASGLGVDQHPVLAGPRALDALPMFAAEATLPSPARHRPDRYGPRRQLWAGTTDVAIYALAWGPSGGPTELLGHVTVDATDPPGIEVWELRTSRLWALLHAAAEGSPGTLILARVASAPPPGPDTVSWQLPQDEVPSHPTSGVAASADVVFRHQSADFTAMLGFDFAAEGADFVLTAVRWWASERTGPLTLNPVQDGNPSAYVGQTTPQPLDGDDWVWPPQAVNQLVTSPLLG